MRSCIRVICLAGILAVGCSSNNGGRTETASQSAAAPDGPRLTTTALDAAVEYLKASRAHQGQQAIETWWDIPAFSQRTFGNDINWLSAADQAQLNRLVLRYSQSDLGHRSVYSIADHARVPRLEAMELGDERVFVQFTFRERDCICKSGLLMQVHEGKAKIIDSGPIESPYSMRLAREYRQTTLSPVKFMEAQIARMAGALGSAQ